MSARARCRRLAPSLVLAACLIAACAGPSQVYCTGCDAAYAECLRADDYEACHLMRRYCLGWCTGAQSCPEACDGASWACEASPLIRSTCVKSVDACRVHCEDQEESEFDFSTIEPAPATDEQP